MSKQESLSKLTRFWVIPFLSGACIALGYVATSKTFILKIHNTNLNQQSFDLETHPTLNEIIEESETIPFSAQVQPVQSNQKNKEPVPEVRSASLLENVKEKRTANISEESSSAVSVETEESIFKQLFQSLPEP